MAISSEAVENWPGLTIVAADGGCATGDESPGIVVIRMSALGGELVSSVGPSALGDVGDSGSSIGLGDGGFGGGDGGFGGGAFKSIRVFLISGDAGLMTASAG